MLTPLSCSPQLALTINNLPKLQGDNSFLCSFTLMGQKLDTEATQTGPDTLTCTTPRTDRLPPIPSGQRESLTHGLPVTRQCSVVANVLSTV